MPRKPKEPKQPIDTSYQDEQRLLQEVQDHHYQSERWMSKLRDDFDEKEALLIGKLEDSQSKRTQAQIFDPRLSTIVFERAARVMAQLPKGKAYAMSRDDIGKNIFMNMLLKFYEKNANEQYSHFVKLRLLDLYSLVYGTMFALVPWRVNSHTGYIGPELNIIPIRDAFPQPGVKNLNEADYFTVRSVVSVDWLKSQNRETWKNIDALLQEIKDNPVSDAVSAFNNKEKTSYVQREYFNGVHNDASFPLIELYTEYRGDQWITYTPQQINRDNSRPHLLRVVTNPYPEGMLPIVDKHAFPLLDSPIGLGEFERGKSLQYAINSLINLYMDGVKFSLFPPLAVDSTAVVPSTIKWGAGEKWLMTRPDAVRPVQLSPQGIGTFQSTYGFLTSALYNQSGTTEVSQTEGQISALGKTPDAIKFIANRESARDEWDRVMMEDTITEVYKRWISLSVEKQETAVEMRLFKDELNELAQLYPNDVTVFESGERGQVSVTKDMVNAKYDYIIESGSTMKPNIEGEQQNLTTILRAVIENPPIVEALRSKGKDIDLGELFKRWMIAGGVKDYDRIIIDAPQPETAQEQPMQSVQPVAADQQLQAGELPIEQLPQQPLQDAMFSDPDIMALASQVMGGMQGIPVARSM